MRMAQELKPGLTASLLFAIELTRDDNIAVNSRRRLIRCATLFMPARTRSRAGTSSGNI